MKRLLSVTLLLLLAAGQASAIERYNTSKMSCAELTAELQSNGKAILRYPASGVHGMMRFEKYVAELMKDQGFTKVMLTERYDYGIDIIALKDGVRWGVQVKRYSRMVKAEAVRQVVTALNKYNCQRAMVVTNSTFSRPAKILAETNN